MHRLGAAILLCSAFLWSSADAAECKDAVAKWTVNLSKDGYVIKWLDDAQNLRVINFAQRELANPPPDLATLQEYPAFAAYQAGNESLGAPNKGGVAWTDGQKKCVIYHINAPGDAVNRLVNTVPKPIFQN
ncbi:hypothetical protein [Telmatospirillum sp.]|uniref:hypothetical protein n=1 Tax=Telmatospirillum sp. TaxID=2079197 RepID=UPI00284C4001|nr:hypothetical protein [Telmatospirillum sp.]MDR3438947.1 hypothetical protein [Telmatospirillum sp.]